MLVFVVLGRVLAPDEFGLVALATVFIAVLAVCVEQGFSQALVQVRVVSREDGHTAFWSSLAVSTALYSALALSAPFLGDAFGEPELVPLLRVLGLTLFLSTMSCVPNALLEREFRFRALALRYLLGTLAGGVIGVLAALAGAGVWALVAQTLSTQAIGTTVLLISSGWLPRAVFSVKRLCVLAGTGLAVVGSELLNAVQGQLDKLIVGTAFGVETLGYYYVATRVLQLVSDLLTAVLGRVGFTTFARLQDDSGRQARAFLVVTSASALLGLPTLGFLVASGHDVIRLLLGTQWDESFPLLAVLALSYAVMTVTYFDRSILIASGYSRVALALAASQTVLSVVLLLAAVPLGLMAVAWSRLVRQLIVWPIRIQLLHRLLAIPRARYVKAFFVTLVPTTLGVIASLLVQETWLHEWSAALRLAASTVAYAAVLAVTMYFFAREQVRLVATNLRRNHERMP